MNGRFSIFCLLAVLFIAAAPACTKEERNFDDVMIMYCCGYNNLSNYLEEDIDQVVKHHIPNYIERQKKRLLIFAHNTSRYGDYLTPSNPVLMDVYKDETGRTFRDTIRVFPDTVKAVSAYTVNRILDFIRYSYPSSRYGLIFSSHSTGWVPKGTTVSVNGFSSYSSGSHLQGQEFESGFPGNQGSYADFPEDTKTIGSQFIGSRYYSYEMEAKDFVEAIPMHLNYLVMDACLAGGIEIAYELTGKVDYYVASQAEIMADGFPYDVITDYLLFSPSASPDVVGLAKAFFNYYDKYGSSATISVVDCNKLGGLSSVCKNLFSRYRTQMRSVEATQAQEYCRASLEWHWFYDLEDVLLKSGINQTEQAELSEALSAAVIYKAATKIAFGRRIIHHCGLSMYLPVKGTSALDIYYKEYHGTGFKWNQATDLVQ